MNCPSQSYISQRSRSVGTGQAVCLTHLILWRSIVAFTTWKMPRSRRMNTIMCLFISWHTTQETGNVMYIVANYFAASDCLNCSEWAWKWNLTRRELGVLLTMYVFVASQSVTCYVIQVGTWRDLSSAVAWRGWWGGSSWPRSDDTLGGFGTGPWWSQTPQTASAVFPAASENRKDMK